MAPAQAAAMATRAADVSAGGRDRARRAAASTGGDARRSGGREQGAARDARVPVRPGADPARAGGADGSGARAKPQQQTLGPLDVTAGRGTPQWHQLAETIRTALHPPAAATAAAKPKRRKGA